MTKDIFFKYWNVIPSNVKASPCTMEDNNNFCYCRFMNFKRK